MSAHPSDESVRRLHETVDNEDENTLPFAITNQPPLSLPALAGTEGAPHGNSKLENPTPGSLADFAPHLFSRVEVTQQ